MVPGDAEAACSVDGKKYYAKPIMKSPPSTPLPDLRSGTQNDPFDRIETAFGRLKPGDTLYLHVDGFYSAVTFPATLQGTAEKPICIEPYGGDRVVFDGGKEGQTAPLALFPAGQWERVRDVTGVGHPDEWRTKAVLDIVHAKQGFRYAQILSTKQRLITYSRVESLRADNESFQTVLLSDERPPDGNPLVGRETHKVPWTYLGPGVFWARENPADELDTKGRIHIRLSPTTFSTPGMSNYDGPPDPNQLPISIVKDNKEAFKILSSHVIFKNITFQSGGEGTLGVSGTHLVFDHCQVYAARYGMFVGSSASNIQFKHCLFDGGLAPWTTRVDVKTEVRYWEGNVEDKYTLGNMTSDLLVKNEGNSIEYDHCTFRRGHDGIHVKGRDVRVHHSLFEDLNDEGIQFDESSRTGDIQIYQNVLRQVLSALSFPYEPDATAQAGPIYIYRNIVDQRVPTRGYRILPPDAPAPFIWRYGHDFKMNGDVTPLFHVYHNTFISSHLDDKGQTLSMVFAGLRLCPGAPPCPGANPRSYLNNIHVGLNVDLPLAHVVFDDATRKSMGNVWYQPHGGAPRFCPPTGKCDIAWNDLPAGWEYASAYGDPGLVNFDDEYFEHQVPYPHTDFSPKPGGLAFMGGVPLPPDLVDPLRPVGMVSPGAGAIPPNGTMWTVGVDDGTILSSPGTPVANAGLDQTLIDTNGDGFENVTLNGMLSSDPGGSIAKYRWTENGALLSDKKTATVSLPEGAHYLRLEVTDNSGKKDTDGVRMVISSSRPQGENLLACSGFEESPCPWQGDYLIQAPPHAHSGLRALQLVHGPQPTPFSPPHQTIPISPLATYTVSAWFKQVPQQPTGPANVSVEFLGAQGQTLQTKVLTLGQSAASYRYREVQVVAPDGATAMKLALGMPLSAPASLIFDDIRVRDRNLLKNGGFETRAPSGRDNQSPHWSPMVGDNVIFTSHPRSGKLAAAMTGQSEYQLLEQLTSVTPGQSYRLSGWIKREPADAPIELSVRAGGSKTVVPLPPQSGDEFIFVSKELVAGSTALTVTLRQQANAFGTAYVDDLLVEPWPPPTPPGQ